MSWCWWTLIGIAAMVGIAAWLAQGIFGKQPDEKRSWEDN